MFKLKTWKHFNFFILIILLVSGCTSQTLDDYHEQGEEITISLTETLKKIRTREQLIVAVPRLQVFFNELVVTMIAAENFEQVHPSEADWTVNQEVSTALLQELNRLYQLEGGKALIEKSQENALQQLEQWLEKQKS